MTASTLPHRTTARPARKPEPSRVVQSYLHIVGTQGKRGALRKTGDIYGISDETVRRYVATHEAAQNVPEVPPELQYIPPPGGYEPPIMPQITTPVATDEPQNDATESGIVTSSYDDTNETGPQESTNATDELPHDTMTQRHSDELEDEVTSDVPMPQPVVVRERVVRERIVIRERDEVGVVGWIREHPGAAHQAVAWVIAAVLIGVASFGG